MNEQLCSVTFDVPAAEETSNVAELRSKALRDTECYLNNPESASWARMTFPRPSRRVFQSPELKAA